MPKQEQSGNWFPSFVQDLNDRDKIRDPSVLNQVQRDEFAEQIVPSIVSQFSDRGEQSPARLRSVLRSMDCEDMFEDVKTVMTDKYDVHFLNLDRQRSGGRGR